MSKTFDELYNSVLKETMTTNTQPTSSAPASNQPAQQNQQTNQQQPQNQNNQAYQKTPTPNTPASQQTNDNDLMKVLQQKLQDQQFKQQLLQMLNSPTKR